MVIISFLVLAPCFFILTAVAEETLTIIRAIENGEINLDKFLISISQLLPILTDRLGALGYDTNTLIGQLNNIVLGTSQYALSLVMSASENILRFLLLAFVMIYLLFFFLKDGDQIIAKCVHAFPLEDNQESFLIEKFNSVTKATVKGTILIGVVQGIIGGVIFALLGIKSAILWGVLMAIFSILPSIGTAIIWFPAACILFVSGAWLKASILLLAGFFIIGLIDNFLRPYLVGKETKLPDYLILLTTLGGVSLVGLSGFVIGPIIAALFLTLWSLLKLDQNT
jgi:predicted PurR-regulated permease PerM